MELHVTLGVFTATCMALSIFSGLSLATLVIGKPPLQGSHRFSIEGFFVCAALLSLEWGVMSLPSSGSCLFYCLLGAGILTWRLQAFFNRRKSA